MNIYDKVFLVNLKVRHDRLAFMKYKLRKSGIENYSVVSAVNGYSDEMIKLFDMYKNRKYYYGIITSPGAIGLIYTWKKMLKESIKSGYKRILILEDDVYFHKNFLIKLKDNVETHEKFNIVMLGGNQLRWDKEQTNMILSDNKYYYSDDKWCCTYGTYGISLDRQAINVIYNAIKGDLHETSMTIDVCINTFVRNKKISGVILYPNIIIPETRDSDNMGTRKLIDISTGRNWILNNYEFINLYDEIIQLREKHINPRQNKNLKINDLTNTELKYIYDGKQTPFVFIIPSYNNEEWVEQNLLSVIKQKYYNWRAIYIDDNSDDKTYEIAKNIIKQHNMEHKFILIRNNKQKFQTYNRYMAYMSCCPEEVCIALDGDDWLAHNNVLNVLNQEYKSNDLLVSYGHFAYYDNGKMTFISGKYEFPQSVIDNNSYRQHGWITQHLRTFKAEVIQKIPIEQLKDQHGNWLSRCSDMAEMFWVLENSNGRHKNIGSLLCVYNKDNSINHSNSYYNEDSASREELIKYVRSHKPTVIQNKTTNKKKSKSDNKVKITKTNSGVQNILSNYTMKHCYYQLEFIQSETFIIPRHTETHYSCNNHAYFKINVKLTNNCNYNFTVKSNDNVFKINHYKKIKTNEYEITVTPQKLLSDLDIYYFTLTAQCTEYPYKKFESQNFNVYTYNNIIYTKIRYRMHVDIFPKDHNQEVRQISRSRWRLFNDCQLIKYLPFYIFKREKIYYAKFAFNEKILDVFISTYRY